MPPLIVVLNAAPIPPGYPDILRAAAVYCCARRRAGSIFIADILRAGAVYRGAGCRPASFELPTYCVPPLSIVVLIAVPVPWVSRQRTDCRRR